MNSISEALIIVLNILLIVLSSSPVMNVKWISVLVVICSIAGEYMICIHILLNQ